MPAEGMQQTADAAAVRIMMPPYVLLRDFLAQDTVDALLDFTLAHEQAFAPTKTGRPKNRAVRPQIRISAGTHDLGPFEAILGDKVLAVVPELAARLGVPPVNSPSLELQLVAHHDGAHYRRHIDTETATTSTHIRVLSCVYYFHTRPKAFTGGALRLHAIGDSNMTAFADIEPEHNALLVFPSWAPHAVMPVSCPAGRFADSRFAVNCWVRRPRAPAA